MAKIKGSKRFVIRGIGFKESDRALRLMAKEITQDQADQLLPLLERARDRMKNIIEPWSFSGELINSFDIEIGKTSNKKHRLTLRNYAPYAAALERGVRPHWVYVDGKMKDWLQAKKPNFSWVRTFHVGGDKVHRKMGKSSHKRTIYNTNSFIKKGSSDRKFFGPVIRQMLDSGEFDEVVESGLKNTLNNFERRARAGLPKK